MSKTYRVWDPDQTYLLPPSPRDWLPDGDLVYFMLDVVQTMDLSPITRKYEKEDRGAPPYHPRMMVTLLLYSYCVGVYSSRRIQKRCERDAAYRVIVGDDVPDFRTISDFRKLHLPELQGLFVEVLKLCAAAGLVKVGLVSLDGAKVKANASRHKAMSYEYMQKEEQRLHKEIAELLAKAKSADEAEDALHGPDKRGDELPAELARRETRLARIQEAKKALETQALEAARAEEARRDAKDEQRRAAGETPRKRKPVDTAPKPKAQYNFTDPESKIMKVSNKGFDQCGNAQAVVNEEQIIIAADVAPQANDKRQVVPMVEQSKENLQAAGVDEKIGAFDADTGYFSEENVSYLEGFEFLAGLQGPDQLLGLLAQLALKDRPPADDDVFATGLAVGQQELKLAAQQGLGVFDLLEGHGTGRAEGTHARYQYVEAATVEAEDKAFHTTTLDPIGLDGGPCCLEV